MEINFKKIGAKRFLPEIGSDREIGKISPLKGGIYGSGLKGGLIDFLPEQGEEEILNIGLAFWVTDK